MAPGDIEIDAKCAACHRPLPLGIKIGWALGQLPIASHIGLVSFYLLYFVTDVHHISPALAGIALALPRLFNILFDPVIGNWSDRIDTRFGRRRPFLIIGAVWWGLALMILFALPVDDNQVRGAALVCGCFLLVSMGQTLYHVPYSAMLAEMTDLDRERISLVAWKEFVSRIGILIAASAVPIVVGLYPRVAVGYRSAGILFGAIIMASGVVAFFATATARGIAPLQQGSRISLRAQIVAVAQNRPFRLLVMSYSFIMLADEIFAETLIYYAVNVLGRTPAFVGQAYPISSVAAIATIPIWNTVAVKIGKRTAFFISVVGMAGAWLSILAIPASQGWLMLPLMAVIGAFNAGLLMLPNAMVPDTIEFDAALTGRRREGAIYGAWIFSQQTAMALGGFLLSMLLAAIGYSGETTYQPESVQQGLSLIIAAVPAAFLAVATLLVVRYPLGRAVPINTENE